MDRTADFQKLALNQRVVIARNLLRAASSESVSRLRSLSLRLAARVLKASVSTDMDILARLQILEGVSQIVPPGPRSTGPWSRNPRRGLALAAAHFAGQPIDPEWFTPQNTHLLDRILAKLSTEIQKFSRGRETMIRADDFIQNALAGLDTEGNLTSKGPFFYQIGAFNKALQSGILSGESPPNKAYPISSVFLVRKIMDSFKNKSESARGRNTVTDSSSGEESSVFDLKTKDRPDRMTILKDLLQTKDSKAARLLFDFFESQLPSGKGAEISLAILRNHLLGGGLSQREIAEQYQVSDSHVTNLVTMKIKPLIKTLQKTDILDKIYDMVEFESNRRYAKRNR